MRKAIITSPCMAGMTVFAQAQVGNRNATATKPSVPSEKKTKLSHADRQKPSAQLNNRKIYHFPNGQRSTPTGAEATASNGSRYAVVGRIHPGKQPFCQRKNQSPNQRPAHKKSISKQRMTSHFAEGTNHFILTEIISIP